MRLKAINCYVAAVCVLAGTASLLVPWSDIASLSQQHRIGLMVLVLFGLLSEWLSVRTTFLPGGSGHTITFIPLLAGVLLFGPTAPVILMGVTGCIAEVFLRRKEAIR